MITTLETTSMAERHREIVRNDYTINGPYSRNHPNSQSDGDVKGRGYGSGAGHTYWLPHSTSQVNVISYRNFDTDPDMNIGTSNHPLGLDDNNARRQMFSRQLYNAQNPYPIGGIIDTSNNILDGQIIIR